MGRTRIFVIQLKELIKMAIFAVMGIALIIMLIYFFVPKDKSVENSALYKAGTYSSDIVLHNGPVSVEVTVNENEITDISLKNLAEVQESLYPLLEQTLETLSREILEKQSLEILVSTDTQYTSQVVLSAIDSALSQAVIR